MSDIGNWTGAGQEPSVTSVALVGGKLRVYFSEPMTNDSGLVDVGNYGLSPQGGGIVALAVVSVTPSDAEYPTFVDLETDKPATIGAGAYEIEVDSGVIDKAGNPSDVVPVPFDGAADPVTFTVTANPVDLGVLIVEFTQAVKQVSAGNADDALNPVNYAIAGATVVKVESVTSISENKVQLNVTGQKDGATYALTVTGVESTSNNEVA